MTTNSSVPGEKIYLKRILWYSADTSFFCPSSKDTCTSTSRESGEVQGRRDPAGKRLNCTASASASTALHWHSPSHRTSTSTPLASINHPSHSHTGGKYLFCWGKNKHLGQNCVRKNTRASTPSHGKRIGAKDFHSPCTHSRAKLALQGTQVLVGQARC